MKNLIVAAVSLSLIASALAQVGSAQDAQAIKIMRNGSQQSRSGAAEYFTGSVRIDPLFEATDPSRASGASVTFAPAARTAWHSHALGQILIVTAGVGRVQRWGDPIDEIRKGDVVWIPPGQKHWHGASPNSAMTHIGVVENPDGERTTWMEKVSDSHYDGAESSSAGAAAQPSRAQTLMGDIAPKLAELTDGVLYADVWERLELSKRDRSLATVAALVAMNRPDQLRSHLALARANGVTREELIETITHLAFYAGWPNAVSAVAVAKEVLEEK